MREDRSDPPRIDENAPEALQEFVRLGRSRRPGGAARDRMSRRLAREATASSPTRSMRSERTIVHWKFALVALAAAGGAWFSFRVSQATSEPLPADTAALATPVSTPMEPTVTRTAESHTAAEEARSEAAAISVDELPSAAPPSARVQAPVAAAGMKPSATELELLKRAQAALASDPERALAITSEQAWTYPSGEFVQEREVIAVEALSQMGRNEDSLRRALALVQRFPRTPYATRLEMVVGRPLSSISNDAEPANRKVPGSSHVAAPNP